ncbi:MAG: DSBA oxidoreductase [Parcubacteria group bacterium GW2011_GWE2_39_37]|uniref:DSBA oxidoreductase n=1 Tax=Candidatus Falkowbacteria bacterium GW2011_GWF2_39_8 TaxID=1618642 RepID=A0A0G0Q6K8_9BACT|nr:MAG: DSBA oxidoreductase [Parcubacteria group bacterium GW2011_GWE2_39_37]KKR32981.1 MAG: DSBA oxidoreductase [Candidatus Falkowbacteria bacterium GW2011_GWF2_39_8]
MNLEAMQTEKPWYLRWYGVIIISFFSFFLIVLVATGFYIFDRVQSIRANPDIFSGLVKFPDTEGPNSFSIGSKNPKVTIVEFADYACPFSKNSFPIIRRLALKYNSQVKFIYRDFPYISEQSIDLTIAARCAGEQGLFWQMHDKLYEQQGLKTKEELSALATQIGVNSANFNNCQNSNKYQIQIQKDLADAARLDVQGTPTWFINGYKFEGDIPEETMERIIQEFLKL